MVPKVEKFYVKKFVLNKFRVKKFRVKKFRVKNNPENPICAKILNISGVSKFGNMRNFFWKSEISMTISKLGLLSFPAKFLQRQS